VALAVKNATNRLPALLALEVVSISLILFS
jgi:hypothetical protein